MNRRIVTLAAVALMAANCAGLNAAGDRTARDVFYAHATDPDRGNDGWLGIRTSILTRYNDEKSQLRIAEVSDLKSFHSGDAFRFRVQANEDGYLYAFLRNSRGETEMLFPYEKGADNRLRRYRSRSFPDKDWFRFDKQAGVETVYLVLSRERVPEFEALVKDGIRKVSVSGLDALMRRSTGGQSMTYDEEALEGDGAVGATYFVEQPGADRSYLVRRLELIHGNAR